MGTNIRRFREVPEMHGMSSIAWAAIVKCIEHQSHYRTRRIRFLHDRKFENAEDEMVLISYWGDKIFRINRRFKVAIIS